MEFRRLTGSDLTSLLELYRQLDGDEDVLRLRFDFFERLLLSHLRALLRLIDWNVFRLLFEGRAIIRGCVFSP